MRICICLRNKGDLLEFEGLWFIWKNCEKNNNFFDFKSGNVKEEMRESDDDLDDSSKSLENKPGDDPNDHKRLKKNRESARNSR